jgi:hypothetical protein
VELTGAAETFDWLPQASELGWRGPRTAAHRAVVKPDATVIVAAELSDHLPAYTWGDAARLAIRAATIGYGLVATIHGESLDDVFAMLRRPPVGLTDDELSHLGVVLVLRRVGPRRRVVAAHYVRPVSRDAHGHVQRLGPAVLATWDPATDRLEHFGWGVAPELAIRTGRRAGDFEIEAGARRALLDELVASRVTDSERVRAAIAGHVATETDAAPTPRPPATHHHATTAPN